MEDSHGHANTQGHKPSILNDLRPISIGPIPGRLMEQILHEQISQFIHQNKLLAEQQFGFRGGRSTMQALGLVLDKRLEGIEWGEVTVAVSIDF